MTGAKSWEDLREGYMAGPRGVPSGHPVAVEVPVVLLQLVEVVKGHKAVLALLLNAQEVIPPALRQSLSKKRKKRPPQCTRSDPVCIAPQSDTVCKAVLALRLNAREVIGQHCVKVCWGEKEKTSSMHKK